MVEKIAFPGVFTPLTSAPPSAEKPGATKVVPNFSAVVKTPETPLGHKRSVSVGPVEQVIDTKDQKPKSKPKSSDTSFRVMTFNVRWDDLELKDSKRAWKFRKDKVFQVLLRHKADLIGLQEPFADQLTDLIAAFPEYECYRGAALLSENQQRAYNPIFYRRERFELLQSGFFFLSETPHQSSLGWTAKIPRSVSWVRLKDRQTGKDFYFFNTHFDYFSKLARNESARLLRQKIKEIAGKKQFIVGGDFNIFQALSGQETLRLLTETTEDAMALIDAQTITIQGHFGPTGSWSGFTEGGKPGVKPDFLFVQSEVFVLMHAILADAFEGEFASDHLPVMADLSL